MGISNEIKNQILLFHELFSITIDDYEDFDEEITHVPNMKSSEYFKFLEKRKQTAFGKLFYISFHDFIVNKLIKVYKDGNADERNELIDLLKKHYRVRTHVWSLMHHYRWLLQHSSQEQRPSVLQTFLIFAILDEQDLDYFETANLLRGAWNEAAFNGMNPALFFQEAAKIAGNRKIIFGRSANELLNEFSSARQ